MSRFTSVFSQLLQLFSHRDLWAWLDNPFTGPSVMAGPEQRMRPHPSKSPRKHRRPSGDPGLIWTAVIPNPKFAIGNSK